MSRLAQQIRRWLHTRGLSFWNRPNFKAGSAASTVGISARHGDAKSLGTVGEIKAAEFLKELGYSIIARGHRQRLGEIDLIALDGSCVVFVEVKTWASDDVDDPSVAVNRAKQQKITRTALTYLKRHRLLNQPARFDVIAIVWNGNPTMEPRIRHFRNAFEAVGCGQMFC